MTIGVSLVCNYNYVTSLAATSSCDISEPFTWPSSYHALVSHFATYHLSKICWASYWKEKLPGSYSHTGWFFSISPSHHTCSVSEGHSQITFFTVLPVVTPKAVVTVLSGSLFVFSNAPHFFLKIKLNFPWVLFPRNYFPEPTVQK